MDLLANIRNNLPWLPPDQVDDVIAEVAILVLEGRIEEKNISAGINRYLPALKKKYKSANFDISLDQPIGKDEGSSTLGEVVHKASPLPKKTCPNCRKKVKAGKTYCSRDCGCKYRQRMARKIDPQELAELHKVRWLSRDRLAKIFGVTRNGINNVISRHKLSRFLPEICKISGCKEPAVHVRHCKGHLAGNLCLYHKRKQACIYMRNYRQKNRTRTPVTAEQKKENARKASIARWSKPEWIDPKTRSDFGRKVGASKMS